MSVSKQKAGEQQQTKTGRLGILISFEDSLVNLVLGKEDSRVEPQHMRLSDSKGRGLQVPMLVRHPLW